MSDHTNAQVTVYAVPDDAAAAAVRQVLQDACLDVAFADQPDLESGGLRLGLVYMLEEMVVGEIADVGRRLAEIGATFEASQEGMYSGEGVRCLGAPGLGLFTGPLTCTGSAAVTAEEITRAVAGTTDRDALVRELELLTGAAWVRAVDGAKEAVVADPAFADVYGAPFSMALPLCATCGATVTGDCAC